MIPDDLLPHLVWVDVYGSSWDGYVPDSHEE